MSKVLKLSEEHNIQQSQKMLHSLKLLQMSEDELYSYIEDILLDNPVLEFEKPFVTDREYPQNQTADWDNVSDPASTVESLSFYLNDQIDRLMEDEADKRLCRAMVGLLDEKGYLDEKSLDLLNVADEKKSKALAVFKTLDPPGIGAKDLTECLCLQLKRLPYDTAIEELLVTSYLQDIGTGNYSKIEKKTGLKRDVILRAVDTIKDLSPRPINAFDDNRVAQTIYPDFNVEIKDGRLELSRNEAHIFGLQINPTYAKLYHERCEGDVTASNYLRKHIEFAKLLIFQLNQRENTMVRCVETIVKKQKDYFMMGSLLVPLTLSDVAAQLNVSPSTVSRAINGRYLMFKNKIYPIKSLMAKSIGGNDNGIMSVYQIKALIKEIIENESNDNPTTDYEICEILLKGGVVISRRTIAKYRKELMIPSSRQRKCYEKNTN